MSFADQVFVRTCKDIIKNGSSDEQFKVRPKWLDGTPAHTKMLVNVCQHYQLAKDSIPVMTLRKTGFRNAIDEILWIYQRHSNNVKDLNSHIWDSWAAKSGDDIGSIGKAYGYQIAQKYRHHRLVSGENLGGYPSAEVKDGWVLLDQIDGVIWSLKNNPADRAIMTNMYNHQDIADMHLRPCAYSMTFNVTVENGEKVLNAILNQRSQDTLTANNWNVVQYSVLVQMLAQVCGMRPGKFTHMVANMHIYDRHIPIVERMIERYNEAALQWQVDHPSSINDDPCDRAWAKICDVPHPNPKFWINPDIKDFYHFTVDDFKLIDYEYEPFDDKIEVAV